MNINTNKIKYNSKNLLKINKLLKINNNIKINK